MPFAVPPRGAIVPVNAVSYGFTTSNTAADNATALEAAMAASHKVYIPAGTYSLNFADIPSNTELYGDGDATILQQPSSATANQQMLNVDSGSATVANNVKNIHIHDLQLYNATGTFSGAVHLLALNGVSNVVIERVKFKGFRGDGLYLGSGNSASQERHNQNVTVRDCRFDGVDYTNRNGISVIDCDTLLVERCWFENMTETATASPGCIDLEYDTHATFAVIRNITIRDNHFEGTQASADGYRYAVAMGFPNDQSTQTTPVHRILIEGNHIETARGIYMNHRSSATASTPSFGIVIRDNVLKNTIQPFVMNGMRGAKFIHNQVLGSTRRITLGESSGGVANYDIEISDNLFYQCASDNTYGTSCIESYTTTYLRIERNVFDDCGRANSTAGRAVYFPAGCATFYARICDNVFRSPGSRTTTCMAVESYAALTGVTGGTSLGVGTFTKTAHGYANGTVVVLSALSGGDALSTAKNYYVVNTATDTFQLAETYGGAAVPTGSAVASVTVTGSHTFDHASCQESGNNYGSLGRSATVLGHKSEFWTAKPAQAQIGSFPVGYKGYFAGASASALGYEGFVCTAAGTYSTGTFKYFGAVV